MADEKAPKTPAAKDGKVFDIASGKSAKLSNTSRPVIVGHTNMIQKDPMVSAQAPQDTSEISTAPEDGLETEKLDKPKREVVLQPVSPEVERDSIPEEGAAQENAADVAQQDADPEPPVAEKSSSETAAVDALVNEVSVKREREKEEDEKIRRDSEIAEMVASKKYFVKIHTPASKKKARLFVVLAIALVLGAAGWFFGLGPGVDMWNKEVESVAVQTPAPSSTQQTQADKTKAEEVAKNATFSNPKFGLAFTYPTDWKVETAKDAEFATRDVVTLKSPVEKIKISNGSGGEVEAEVFLRTRIFVENTISTKEYASDLVKMSSCSSEDVVVGSQNMKLLYVDLAKAAPNISQVSLSPSNCVATGALFNADDQVQLPSKKNTYIFYTEYILSDAHLKKNGTTTPEAIALAQESGVIATKDSFKAGNQYKKFVELIKSLREEQQP